MSTSRDIAALRRELAALVSSCSTVEDRARAVLQQLGERLPFDAGWLAVRDPERRLHTPLATVGATAPLRAYFARPDADDEVERLGLNGRRPPMLATEVPVPLSDVAAWADHLLPAGFRNGLASALFTARGRHVGFLSLISSDRSRPTAADRALVAAVTTAIAENVDRTRDIAETAGIVGTADAGVVLSRAGDVLAMPGLPGDRLVAPGSRVLTVVADELAAGGPYLSFLCEAPGSEDRLRRVVALDLARPELDHLSAAVLVGPPGDLLGLTVGDLRLLGLVVEGVADPAALARGLRVAPRVAADSLERVLFVLGTRDLAVAAVRALRRGLRIPPGVSARA
ncbi:hypothetical protein ACXR2U_01535 [Jatrophihabitans sp. YIM 134969]